MDTNTNTNTKMLTNERIEALKKRYTEKGISRRERTELMNEIARERYKIDPRKPISYRNQMAANTIMSFLMSVNFGFMGISETIGLKNLHRELNSVIEIVIIILMVLCIAVYSFMTSKYKYEPSDELAQKNTVKANNTAFIISSMILLLLSIIYFMILGHEQLVIKGEAATFLICGFIMFTSFLGRLIFLILEGKDDIADDDEEEE